MGELNSKMWLSKLGLIVRKLFDPSESPVTANRRGIGCGNGHNGRILVLRYVFNLFALDNVMVNLHITFWYLLTHK